MLWARFLADAIVVFHAAFVAFVVLGMVAIVLGLALRRGWVGTSGSGRCTWRPSAW